MAEKATLAEDNRDEVKETIKQVLDRALEAVGIQASGDVALACPVDTGLLRNSITYAVAGKSPNKATYHGNDVHASTKATRKAGTAGKSLNAVRIGRYDGDPTPEYPKGSAVYIGTNVEYAP